MKTAQGAMERTGYVAGDLMEGGRHSAIPAAMIGIGAANIAAGAFQGFAVSTSGSRTAVAEQSGAKTQLSGIVGAGVVAALLLFFNSLLTDLPQSALAAVVIAAVAPGDVVLVKASNSERLWRVADALMDNTALEVGA